MENLNRKPQIFPLRLWGFPVNVPLNPSIEQVGSDDFLCFFLFFFQMYQSHQFVRDHVSRGRSLQTRSICPFGNKQLGNTWRMKVARMWHVPSKVMRFVLYCFIFHFGIQKMKGMLHTFTLRFRVRKAACFSAPQWSGKHFALGLMIPTVRTCTDHP